MVFNAITRHVHKHIRLHHHRITSHPHYELVAAHGVEVMSVLAAFFVAISFGSQHNLSPNEGFIYPLQQISHPSCKFEDRDTLSGKCIIDLPRIKGADFEKYQSDTLVRGVYSVLWSSSYEDGRDRAGGHSGVDVRTSEGTPLVSIGNGVVVDAGFNKGYGNVVKIKYLTPTGQVIYAVYAHLHTITTKAGHKVSKGEKIGTVGNTGMSHGVHLHYEIDTTTRRGDKPLYPYANCEEKDAYLQNNTDVCIDMLREHTNDPIVFHEKYLTTLVASSDPVPVAEPTPKPTPAPKSVVATIDSVITEKSDTRLQSLYDAIRKHVPAVTTDNMGTDAQKFFDTYGIEITHAMTPSTSVGSTETIELYIYNKATKQPYTGSLSPALAVVTANDAVSTMPAAMSHVDHGRLVIRIQGQKKGASIVGLTMDDVILYALPVLVE